jgi:HTH-type transcriptional regulator, competence development regulator
MQTTAGYPHPEARSTGPMIGFGAALRYFREQRGFSLRELGTLSRVDHAYIHRLEEGEKSMPSLEVLDRLATALKLSGPRRELLRALLSAGSVPDGLFHAMVQHPAASIDAFQIASKTSFRGARPTTPDDWIRQLDELDIRVLNNRDQ